MSRERASLETPLGPITLLAEGGALKSIDWRGDAPPPMSSLMRDSAKQLDAYFAGDLQDFDLPLAPEGSDFTQTFLAALSAIPYGETKTYGDLGEELGVPAQAIGQACGANPIPIIIPCHRVLAADGLGGFSAKGGVETKVALLKLEGAASLLI